MRWSGASYALGGRTARQVHLDLRIQKGGRWDVNGIEVTVITDTVFVVFDFVSTAVLLMVGSVRCRRTLESAESSIDMHYVGGAQHLFISPRIYYIPCYAKTKRSVPDRWRREQGLRCNSDAEQPMRVSVESYCP